MFDLGNIGMLHGIQQHNLVEIPFVSDNIHQHLANQTFNNLKPRKAFKLTKVRYLDKK